MSSPNGNEEPQQLTFVVVITLTAETKSRGLSVLRELETHPAVVKLEVVEMKKE